ncbi:EAL domain-containing protein [Rhodoferax sp.]|uniref:EAL domain-containing protein n=1 Tax=Rhodoferax sp. TaxID=50421 RepID=UPI0025E670A9|nr:EAL domain-containing protein [Rhodoferax sp.]
MSMYRQLWLAIIASMLLALGGGLLASLLSARGYLESQLAIKNTDNATALALALSQSDPDPVSVELVAASLFDSGHYQVVRVVDPSGLVITERIAPSEVLDAPAWFSSLLPIQSAPGQAQISNGWKQFGTVTLISHSRFAYGALWKSAKDMTVALALAGLVGGWLGSLVLGRLRRPLNTVIEQASAISQRRFVMVDEPEVPELKQLASAMNATVGRLKSMFDDEASRLEQVRQEANFDGLTGLANRGHFLARLRQCMDSEDSTGGVLMMVRLADLAGVNRRLGRASTDDFIKLAGGVMARIAEPHAKAVPARLNGADFALLIPGNLDGAALAKQLMDLLGQESAPFVEGGRVAAVGFGRFLQGEEMGELLARIDSALASAELGQANSIHEAPLSTNDDLPRTADQWSVMIRRALEHGWVRLISFPVMSMEGALSHRECPLRLMFDERGEWLPAGRFLPIAERLKLTAALDLKAVELGLQDLSSNPTLTGLAINLSASSLEDRDFSSALLGLIKQHGEAARRLWLEVAEEGVFKHLEAFRALCPLLKASGCHVGLEHFGHRFSQIGQLHDLGLDYLKVDSSFVRGVDANAGNAAFLKGLCSIAHNIGLQVIAEGVSTSAEGIALKAIGFDAATGPSIQE